MTAIRFRVASHCYSFFNAFRATLEVSAHDPATTLSRPPGSIGTLNGLNPAAIDGDLIDPSSFLEAAA